MLERSYLAAGNTERLHAAIEKAKAGETVTLAYLGGSITEGALAKPRQTRCYAYLSAQAFAKRYMPDAAKLKYVNAGISGTPSLLGITRLEADVLRHQPDIVFVEFAVNDSGDSISQGVYESLLRKLLTAECEPAVILIFTVLSGGNSCQEHMAKLGAHYKLGMVSVKDAIWPEIEAGRMVWNDYSADNVHPNNAGHAFMADAIDHYFEMAEAVPAEPFAMPRFIRFANLLEGLENIRHGDSRILSTGSFPVGPAACYSYAMGWWHKGLISGTEPLVVAAEGSCMTVAYKQMKDTTWGSAQLWVDGVCKATLPGYDQNAWGNIKTQLITFGDKGLHTIELRMAEGQEGKQFQLLDIAIAP
jgi:lysophospholipase L1-like esterase